MCIKKIECIDTIKSGDNLSSRYKVNRVLKNRDIIDLIGKLSNKYLLKYINYGIINYDDETLALYKTQSLKELYERMYSDNVVNIAAVYSLNGIIDNSEEFILGISPDSKKINVVYQNVETLNFQLTDVEEIIRKSL